MGINNIDSWIKNEKNKKYSITYSTELNLFDTFEKSKNRIRLSQETILQYFQILQQIFESFYKNWKTFNDTFDEKIRELWENIDWKIISLFLLVRNYCNQFDMIYKKSDWEIVCEKSVPNIVRNHENSVKFNTSRGFKKMFLTTNNELVKIFSPNSVSLEFSEIFRRIRNWIAHWDSWIIQESNWKLKVIIDSNDLKAEVDHGFFVTWMTFLYNSKSKDWCILDVNKSENTTERTEEWGDKEIEDIDNLQIWYTRYKNKNSINFTYWEIIHSTKKFNLLKRCINDTNYFDKYYIQLDDFQLDILKEQLKIYKNNWKRITRGFISQLIPLVYYYTTNNGNQYNFILMNRIQNLFNQKNQESNHFDDSWIKRQKYYCEHFWAVFSPNKLILWNIDNIIKRQYLKYYFTKQERPWNDRESKIHRHLRNCFIHEYYTHLPINKIGFQDHPKGNETDITFLWNCKVDELYEKILEDEPIYNIFNIHYIR